MQPQPLLPKLARFQRELRRLLSVQPQRHLLGRALLQRLPSSPTASLGRHSAALSASVAYRPLQQALLMAQ